MQTVLSADMWAKLRSAAGKSGTRKAAFAYSAKDLIGFRRGDVLVVEASELAIKTGATNARLLASLHRKGVAIFHSAGLHAKVLLLDQSAFIGSSNLSQSSATRLIEAGVLTDSRGTMSQVESFIEQLVSRSHRLDGASLRRLCRIKVKRVPGPWSHGGRRKPRIAPLGTRTWIVGTCTQDRDWSLSEWTALAADEHAIARTHGIHQSAIDWIRWSRSGRFLLDGSHGDQMIQIWSSSLRARPSFVWRATAVLHKLRIGKSTFVAIAKPRGKKQRIRFGAFKVLMKRLGNRRPFGGSSERALEPELAEAIERSWKQT